MKIPLALTTNSTWIRCFRKRPVLAGLCLVEFLKVLAFLIFLIKQNICSHCNSHFMIFHNKLYDNANLCHGETTPWKAVLEQSRMRYSLGTSREMTWEQVLRKGKREPPSCNVLFSQQRNKLKITWCNNLPTDAKHHMQSKVKSLKYILKNMRLIKGHQRRIKTLCSLSTVEILPIYLVHWTADKQTTYKY